MNEELMNIDTDDTLDITIEEVIEYAEEIEQDIEVQETIETIQVEAVEEIVVEVEEAVGWVGGDNTRHYSLYGRDEADQHPIAAITGLREELDDIEALDVVFSNEKNQADYYLWEDENPMQDVRVGLFVTLCNDTNKIKICAADDDIFGVTVDTAAFVGGQDDVARDAKYGLVAYGGVAAVQCELEVEAGDYVVSNSYGMAKQSHNGYGYKVFALEQIHNVAHAVISLGVPGNIIHALSNDVNALGERMDDAEANIVAAMNVANEAYKKAGEVGDVSEEALKNALDALKQSGDLNDSISDRVTDIESDLSSMGAIVAESKAIAEGAATSAATSASNAAASANGALAEINDLIKDLEPITTWKDPESGNSGAEYFTNYINNGLATNVYVAEVNTKTEDNKSAIEYNAEQFKTLVSSVDKYSVGEYSQSYGLTQAQATSILKEGMIYVPTKHSDTRSHSEKFEDTGEVNEFTPGSYYVWYNNDWMEMPNTVAFFSEVPIPGDSLRYWYIDADDAPEGYEPHALYMWENGKWEMVNILAGNVNNRVTSTIRQTANEIALEVSNVRGSYTGLDARLTNTEAELQLATFWTNPDSGKSNLAAVNLDSSDDGSSLALVVMSKDGETQLNGASIVLNNDDHGSSICFDADYINFDTGTFKLNANYINLDGYATINDKFSIDLDGAMTATGGTIGGWDIDTKSIARKHEGDKRFYICSNPVDDVNSTSYDSWVAAGVWNGTSNKWDWPFYVLYDGTLKSTKANITGVVNATSGLIGGWTISPKTGNSTYTGGIYKDIGEYRVGMKAEGCGETDAAFYVTKSALDSTNRESIFYVQHNGKLFAKDAVIEGDIKATSGSFSRDITIAGKSLSEWISDEGDVQQIKAVSGTVGGWNIDRITINDTDGTQLYSGQALYSNEWVENGATLRVAFTPRYVYTYGRNSDGTGVVNYASWWQIINKAHN